MGPYSELQSSQPLKTQELGNQQHAHSFTTTFSRVRAPAEAFLLGLGALLDSLSSAIFHPRKERPAGVIPIWSPIRCSCASKEGGVEGLSHFTRTRVYKPTRWCIHLFSGIDQATAWGLFQRLFQTSSSRSLISGSGNFGGLPRLPVGGRAFREKPRRADRPEFSFAGGPERALAPPLPIAFTSV